MDCKTWLKELLEHCGHISGKSAYATGKVIGFKKLQIKVAKKELGVITEHVKFKNCENWYWNLPKEERK